MIDLIRCLVYFPSRCFHSILLEAGDRFYAPLSTKTSSPALDVLSTFTSLVGQRCERADVREALVHQEGCEPSRSPPATRQVSEPEGTARRKDQRCVPDEGLLADA